jgi:FkbM family methyltransferase
MKSGRRLDLFEVVLLCAFVLVATWVGTQHHFKRRQARLAFFAADAESEIGPLERKYGGRHYSRNMEEWLIRDFFNDRRDGVFLDVGANHYRNESNTYFLETALGWSGVAIDALEEFASDYRTYRPRTKFVAMFASDQRDRSVQFFVPADNKLVASKSQEFTVREGSPGIARTVPTTTLDAVLEDAAIAKLDFLSMDIELSEPQALAGFDIARYQPRLVCIEAHPEVRQQILDYFARRAYTVVGKYLRADPRNLYFQPLASQ